MRPPVIGITTYAQDEAAKFALPREYVDAVRRAGGLPLLAPPGETRLEELFAAIDGLLLAGGGDLDPCHYGGCAHDTIYNLDAERDTMELALARAAVRAGLPTLGICRGMQVINVALGGTLIEHLPDVVGEQVIHRVPPRGPTPHDVSVEPRSRLAKMLGEVNFSSASWHHQAVREVAPGLNIVARAPDGTIEAVELPDHPWMIAVQWHPELTAGGDAIQRKLFAEFIAAAARSRDEKGN